MIKCLLSLVITGLCTVSFAKSHLPASLSLGVVVDEEKNSTYEMDLVQGLGDWQLLAGFSASRLVFDEQDSFWSRTGYVGATTDPLEDYQLSGELHQSAPSELVRITDALVGGGFYWGDFYFKSSVGARRIFLNLTQALQTDKSEIIDTSLLWNADASYVWKDWMFRVYHSQFYYEENLKPFTRQLALLAGYDPATINQASSFVNFRAGANISYSWRKFIFGFDFNHSELKFISGETQNYTVQVSYDFSKSWGVAVYHGVTASIADTEEATSSYNVLNLLMRW